MCSPKENDDHPPTPLPEDGDDHGSRALPAPDCWLAAFLGRPGEGGKMKQLWLTAKLDIVESLRARWFQV